ncbi:hypothetical protein A7W90_17575 [Clostridium sp. Bc-iso-3]|nr:hypothetical protein A7W90_17575 [Clostridium sp. Bc-iso-3]
MKKVISMIVVVAMLTTLFAGMIPQKATAASTMTVEIGKVTGAVGSTVEIPVTLSGVPSKGIVNGDFVLGYDRKVLEVTSVTAGDIVINARNSFDGEIYSDAGEIAFLYSEDTGRGTEAIKQNGVFAVITATVKSASPAPITLKEFGAFADNDLADISTIFIEGGVNLGGSTPTPKPTVKPNGFTVEIGKVKGAVGATVEIPVYFSGVPSKGLVNADFTLKYDPKVLTIEDVVAGDIVINARNSFDAEIYSSAGEIAFLYSEDTGRGTEAIKQDGVFAIITATVKTSGSGAITCTEVGGFADNDLVEHDVTFISGGVNVGDVVATPTPTKGASTPTPTKKPTAPPSGLVVEISKVTAAVGATVEIPVYFSGVPSKGLVNADFTLKYDPKVLTIEDVVAGDIVINARNSFDAEIYSSAGEIAFLYSEDTGRGTEAIKQDGVFAIITATVKTSGSGLITCTEVGGFADNDLVEHDVTFISGGVNVGDVVATPTPTKGATTPSPKPTLKPGSLTVEIGKVTAAVGATVEIPVYFSGVPSKGLVNADFTLKYDPKVLTIEEVVAGDIVINARNSFDAEIYSDVGEIAFLYSEDTGRGTEAIKQDGVFAIIRATVKTSAPGFITCTEVGGFADNDLTEQDVTFISGGVNVGNATPTPTKGATPTPTKPATPTPTKPATPTPTKPVASGNLKIEFYNSNPADSSNSINPQFKITNNGSSAVDLSKLTLRYYYTIDGQKDQTFWCDHAAIIGSNGSYNGFTANVKATFVKMSSSTNNADTYLEISFTGGSLEAGANLQIQGRFAKNDWSNYTQSNDYSFKAGSQYVEWDQVTAYLNGSLIWGKEPGGTVATPTPTKGATATPTPTKKATPTPTKPIDPNALKVTIDTVSGKAGSTVQIPVSFSGVPSKGLVNCDFTLKYDPKVLTIEEVVAGDIVINAKNSFDAEIYSDVGEIAFLYSEDTGRGTEAIKANGVFAIITATIKAGAPNGLSEIKVTEVGGFADNDLVEHEPYFTNGGVVVGGVITSPTPTVKPTIDPNKFAVTIETVSGKAGSTVEIPVKFSGVPSKGLVNADFTLKYDPKVLTIEEVVAGDIVINAKNSFDAEIYSDVGEIAFLYSEDTGRGTEAIKEDGVFAIITATIKAGAPNGLSEIKATEIGGFADNDLVEHEPQIVNGGVVVGGVITSPTPTVKPTIDPNKFAVTIETVSGKAGSTVQIPVNFSGVPSKGLVNADFTLKYDPKVLTIEEVVAGDIVINARNSFDAEIYSDVGEIAFLYSEDTGRGTEAIKADGVFAIITATIKAGAPNGLSEIKATEIGGFADNDLVEHEPQIVNGGVVVGDVVVSPTPTVKPTSTVKPTIDPNKFAVTIETVTGKAGSTVQIPVNFSGVPSKGLVNADFTLKYDPKVLTIEEVVAGDIVINARNSFDAEIYSDAGEIAFLYSEDTGRGTEAIKADGVFAIITATIKTGAPNGLSEIKAIEIGGFADNDLVEHEPQIVNGGVVVGDVVVSPTPTETVEPTPKPTETVEPTINPDVMTVKIGKVQGRPGETVEIPMNLFGVPEAGIVNGDFSLKYDPSVLTIEDVVAGDIVINARNSFDAQIYPEDASIAFLYAEDTGRGTEAIKKDGLFATIIATINAGAPDGLSVIELETFGSFADNDLVEIETEFINGGVLVSSQVESGYKVSGYILPDFSFKATNGPIVKAGFKVEVVGTDLYAVTDADGYFEIAEVPESAIGYTLKISRANYLDREIANVIVSGDTEVSTSSDPIMMWAGDIVKDNAINMKDVMEIFKSFNTTPDDALYNVNADLNRNDAVNMEDVMIIMKHFDTTPADYNN